MPTTSVIIPVYNDAEGLRTTVDSLLVQSEIAYEIIISDNGSVDGTYELSKEYATKFDRVRLVVEDEIQGSYAARNKGIRASNGDVIGFLDADMWVASNYIESITKAVLEDGKDYVGCHVQVVTSGKRLSRYNAASGFPVERYIQQSNFAPTCCLVVHRRVIEDVGMFDERLMSSGDLEFGNRVADAGYELDYESDIVVFHPAREDISEFVSKYIRLGRGDAQISTLFPDQLEKGSVFQIKPFLPPHPLGFYRAYKDEARGFGDYFTWYFFYWFLKLLRFSGRIHEHVIGNRRRN